MFSIAGLPLGPGRLGIGPLPGRAGDYAGDLAAILAWRPALVATMTTEIEMEAGGAEGLPADLAAAGIVWRHLAITDFRAPCSEVQAAWPAFSAEARAILAEGGRVMLHCYGGCGRSGMAALRLMVEAGELADHALARLRDVRPCAVETGAQMAWAAVPMWERLRQAGA